MVAATVVYACDWGQTRSAAREAWSGGRTEGGMPAMVILGETPTVRMVDGYFAASALALFAAAHLIPERYRFLGYVAVAALEGRTAYGNLSTTSGFCGL